MNIQRVKALLTKILGIRLTACIEAIALVYVLRKAKYVDHEIHLISRFLKAGDVAVDVGANGADWTYYLHRQVGEQGEVYAFEADPYYALATDIAIRLMRLKGVRFFPFGLSDKDENVPFRTTSPDGLRPAGLGHIDKDANLNETGVEAVQLKRLDSLANEYPRLSTVSLIKCDVEGYELFVLRGATELLLKARPIVILEVGHYDKQGYAAHDVYSFFSDKGYCAVTLVAPDILESTNEDLEHEAALGPNRILIPKEKMASVEDIVIHGPGRL